MESLSADIFQTGHFSVFDVLVHLSDRGDIRMDYHYDVNMDTQLEVAVTNDTTLYR